MQSNQPANSPAPQALASLKYRAARSNLLLLTFFSTVNIIMALTASPMYMLFSATVPYYIAAAGRSLLEEYGSMRYIGAVAAAAIILTIPYVIFWLLSKKHYGAMIAALVYFSLDCAALVYVSVMLFDAGMIIDILFHAWILYYLIIGVKYGGQLKKHSSAEPFAEAVPPIGTFGTVDQAEDAGVEPQDSPALREAGEVKHKVHAAADAFGHHIVYRKVGKRDELVVDGMVYGEYLYRSWTAQPHILTAYVRGMKITAGFAMSSNFIRVNDAEFAKSTRWV